MSKQHDFFETKWTIDELKELLTMCSDGAYTDKIAYVLARPEAEIDAMKAVLRSICLFYKEQESNMQQESMPCILKITSDFSHMTKSELSEGWQLHLVE